MKDYLILSEEYKKFLSIIDDDRLKFLGLTNIILLEEEKMEPRLILKGEGKEDEIIDGKYNIIKKFLELSA